MPVANKVELHFVAIDEYVPMARVMKMDIRQEPGVDAQHFYFPFHDDYKAIYDDAVNNAKTAGDDVIRCRLKLTTCDPADPEEPLVSYWDGWYAMRIAQDRESEQIWNLLLQDIREVFRSQKFTGMFNVKLNNGDVVEASLIPGVTPFRHSVQSYMTAVVEDFRAKFQGLPAFTLAQGTMSTDSEQLFTSGLPWNLGNTETESGGWVGATFAEMMELVEKAFGLRIMPTVDGGMAVVDNEEERPDVEALIDVAMKGSSLTVESMEPSLPRELELVVEVRKEILAETRFGSSSPPPTRGLILQQVMRLPADLTNPLSTDFKWVDIDTWANSPLFDGQVPQAFRLNAQKYIAERYFKDNVIPPNNHPGTKLPKAGAEVVDFANGEIEDSFGSRYRLVVSSGTIQDRWNNIRIGRLNEDGGTVDGGMVFSSFTIIRARAKRSEASNNPGYTVLVGLLWSESHHINASKFQPAPFLAYFTDASGGILSIDPAAVNKLIVKGVVNRMATKQLRFDNYIEMVKDADADDSNPSYTLAVTKPDGKLAEYEQTRVVLNGCPALIDEREYVITKSLFPDGVVSKQRLKVYGETANFKFDDATLVSAIRQTDTQAATLMNGAVLDEIAERVAAEVIKSFKRGRMGAVKLGGIGTIESHQAGGEVSQMWVEIGYEKSFSITTNYSIRPGAINIEVERKRLDGKPVRVMVQ